jgi:hypothetical protein
MAGDHRLILYTKQTNQKLVRYCTTIYFTTAVPLNYLDIQDHVNMLPLGIRANVLSIYSVAERTFAYSEGVLV